MTTIRKRSNLTLTARWSKGFMIFYQLEFWSKGFLGMSVFCSSPDLQLTQQQHKANPIATAPTTPRTEASTTTQCFPLLTPSVVPPQPLQHTLCFKGVPVSSTWQIPPFATLVALLHGCCSLLIAVCNGPVCHNLGNCIPRWTMCRHFSPKQCALRVVDEVPRCSPDNRTLSWRFRMAQANSLWRSGFRELCTQDLLSCPRVGRGRHQCLPLRSAAHHFQMLFRSHKSSCVSAPRQTNKVLAICLQQYHDQDQIDRSFKHEPSKTKDSMRSN